MLRGPFQTDPPGLRLRPPPGQQAGLATGTVRPHPTNAQGLGSRSGVVIRLTLQLLLYSLGVLRAPPKLDDRLALTHGLGVF